MDDTKSKQIISLRTTMDGVTRTRSLCPSCGVVTAQVVLYPSLALLAICDTCGWEEGNGGCDE